MTNTNHNYIDSNNNLVLFDARMILRNFEGRFIKDRNPKGVRNFGVVIDEELAKQAKACGYNVKTFDPNEYNPDPTYWIPVGVSFPEIKKFCPTILYYPEKHGKGVLLDADSCGIVDSIDIEHSALVLRLRQWKYNGKSGMKAVLSELKVWPTISAIADYYPYDDDDEIPEELGVDSVEESF